MWFIYCSKCSWNSHGSHLTRVYWLWVTDLGDRSEMDSVFQQLQHCLSSIHSRVFSADRWLSWGWTVHRQAGGPPTQRQDVYFQSVQFCHAQGNCHSDTVPVGLPSPDWHGEMCFYIWQVTHMCSSINSWWQRGFPCGENTWFHILVIFLRTDQFIHHDFEGVFFCMHTIFS